MSSSGSASSHDSAARPGGTAVADSTGLASLPKLVHALSTSLVQPVLDFAGRHLLVVVDVQVLQALRSIDFPQDGPLLGPSVFFAMDFDLSAPGMS